MRSTKFKPDRRERYEHFHGNADDFDWFGTLEVSNDDHKVAGTMIHNIRRVMEKHLLIPLRIGILFDHATLLAFTAVWNTGSIFTAILLAPAEFYVAARQHLLGCIVEGHVLR